MSSYTGGHRTKPQDQQDSLLTTALLWHEHQHSWDRNGLHPPQVSPFPYTLPHLGTALGDRASPPAQSQQARVSFPQRAPRCQETESIILMLSKGPYHIMAWLPPIEFRVWTEPFSEFKMDRSTTTLEDHQVVSPCSAVQQRSCIGKDPSHSLHTHENTMSSTMDQGAKSTLVGSL